MAGLQEITSIGVEEDDPKPGYFYINLDIFELKVKKNVKGEKQALNAEVKANITEKFVDIEVKLDTGETHHYFRTIPVPIQVTKSGFKLKKNGRVKLHLCKVENVPWTEYHGHFNSKERK